MDTDVMFVVGTILLVLTVPSIFGAISDGRAPRAAMILIMVGGGLIALASYQKPNGYSFAEVPDVFSRVVSKVIN